MNKIARTGLFIAGATVVNLVVTAGLFMVIIVLYGLTLSRVLPPEAGAVAFFASFVLAVVGAGLVYRQLLKYARKRFELDKFLGGGDRPSRR